jgi:hypothetical protein
VCTNNCDAMCWEEAEVCGATPPTGMQFARGANPRAVDDGKDGNVLTCPGSLVKVNEEECRELGATQGKMFDQVLSTVQHVPGCFFNGGSFHYNTHDTGSVGGAGPLWCKDPASTGEPHHLLFISWTRATQHMCVYAYVRVAVYRPLQ